MLKQGVTGVKGVDVMFFALVTGAGRGWRGGSTVLDRSLQPSPPTSTPLLNGLQRLSLALDRSIEEVG